MVDGVRIEILESESSLQTDGFVALGGSLEPEAIAGLLHFEQLVAALLAEPQFDLTPLLIPDMVGLTIHNLEIIIISSNLLDHPELREVMRVGMRALDTSLVVFAGVVGGNLESLVAIVTDDLVDVSSRELKVCSALHSLF